MEKEKGKIKVAERPEATQLLTCRRGTVQGPALHRKKGGKEGAPASKRKILRIRGGKKERTLLYKEEKKKEMRPLEPVCRAFVKAKRSDDRCRRFSQSEGKEGKSRSSKKKGAPFSVTLHYT